ncbi:MAG TPA: PDR/VanB family oxidoreductase [Nocardioides sp.]|uniref:PDR/VanB family oxidoreductase n=1 Tax=Nocardioides sp. TaxID=35761 RepID=UPI002E30933F|nr:PDR/VanB family oxidoreductase [Nocardioides sp.]HEX5089431.1 PDR/VanB family oxidoreductase [Nocardioides sp.]
MPLLVHSMTHESAGVVSLELVDPEGRDLPSWEPGSHLDLVLPSGLSRQYSLSGDPHDRRRYRLGVLREPAGQGGSAYVHDTLRPGQTVEFAGPRNHFRLEPAAAYVFVAGGIGITPILPMLAAATAAGAEWTLVYGGRTAASMAFTDELARYGDRVTLWPQDTHGLLDLDGLLGSPRPATLVYCCGPEALLGAVEERMAAWPAGALHLERFSAPVVERDPAAEHSLDVVLAESGRTVSVPPDRSVLDVLLDEGVDVLSDCREGICGTCEVKVVEGEVDHRDYVLSEPEKAANNCMMVCVSRACGKRLVLGL